MRLFRKRLPRFLLVVAVIVAAAWMSGVRLFAFPGESMSPTVRAGDYFVGLIGVWGMRSPDRFDMVIFDVPPASQWARQNIPWMKRLVGLPGDHVRLAGNELFINGRKVEAPFLHVVNDSKQREEFEITLGATEYFVIGDNLGHSFEDSRVLGPIDRSLIKGFVAFIIH
jgi:signal peptidase I